MSKQQRAKPSRRQNLAFFSTVLMVLAGMVLITLNVLVVGFIVSAIGTLLLFTALLAQAYPEQSHIR